MQTPWLVLYTTPRAEKKTAERLANKGFTVYCPVKKVKKQWSDRAKVVEEPLFSSYVFIQIDEKEREQALFVPGVVRYLFWLGKPAVVRPEEIRALKLFLNDFDHSSLAVVPIAPNQRVFIKSGPLSGQEALVERLENNKVILYLPALDCSVQASSKTTLLEAVN